MTFFVPNSPLFPKSNGEKKKKDNYESIQTNAKEYRC